uniref:Uncharacterized protein n=1 Tax=Rhizophagus irregularis (strain DAOM 181602 / DAOM 197198 / MUCL 43194) TaxID=747089 RepID=U9UHF1_RHIID
MYLNLLVIIDNNTKTRLVCQGLLSEDETNGNITDFDKIQLNNNVPNNNFIKDLNDYL